VTASVATSGSAARAYSAPPETGTLTTTQPPAWLTATAYVLDPTSGGISRVVNVGNLYECRANHTSSGGDEPTTTSDTAQWAYLGAAPATNNTVAGSLILALTARGLAGEGDNGLVPYDNDSGSYTGVEVHSYTSYTAACFGVYRRSTAANNKSNFRASADWVGTSPGSGAGDEAEVAWLEIRGVLVGAPHAQSHVERATATGGFVTAASVAITVPCLIVSFWAGNGNVVADGTRHTAVPQGALSLIPNATSLMAISSSGYIQRAVAARIELAAGTYSEQWATNGEGAQLVTLAYALSEITATGAIVFDDMVVSGVGRVRVTGTGAIVFDDMTVNGSAIVSPLPATGIAPIGARIGSRVGCRIG
jgi:hypothetical protein